VSPLSGEQEGEVLPVVEAVVEEVELEPPGSVADRWT